ncbi:uncharacterized protein LTR77_004196 [Saxophila tyrrhenica]|uniref:Zn(2)-C6 fungal-type domain-containing protein n=1 Tax=Saxophila tyrrhenica TaxID=1690608 RepID=A0AAV9PF02_9PEZI|nr:hypothetical protein LTR77_004196 [Saxophila tyrrhenica]
MAYYGDNADFDHFYRPRHRSTGPVTYYGRHPYRHHHEQTRYELRPDPYDEVDNQTYIGQADPQGSNDSQARRRIAIACARCRRRKIKCSGDPGDNTGCSACKSSGADISKDCTFNRVGSHSWNWTTPPELDATGTMSIPAQASGYHPLASASGRHGSHGMHRPSLPLLHTRTNYPPELGSDYNPSPVDVYTYPPPTSQRQDSVSGTYPLESYRSFSTSAPLNAPTTASYEPQMGYTFGAISAPSMSYSQGDSFSALNMGQMHSSLPPSMVHDRRLPIPYVPPEALPVPWVAQLPELRRLEQYDGSRGQLDGTHSRSTLPWTSVPPYTTSSDAPMTTFRSISGLPSTTAMPTTTAYSDPTLGYQFGPMPPISSNSSPDVSPTSGPTGSEGYQSNSGSSTNLMLPLPNARYSAASSHGLPSIITDGRPSYQQGAPPPHYAYIGHRNDTDPNSSDGRGNLGESGGWYPRTSNAGYTAATYPSNTRTANCEFNEGRSHSYNSSSLRQPQPQHPTSIDALCRQSSFDRVTSPQQQQQEEQQQREDHQNLHERHECHDRRRQSSGTTQSRMSISNFNATY